MKVIGTTFGISRWLVGLGVGFAVLAGGTTGLLVEWYQNRELEAEAETVLHRVERRIGDYHTLLLGLRGLFDTFGGVSSGKFNQYIDSLGLDVRYPGILRMEYVERIPDAHDESLAEAVPVYRPIADPAFEEMGARFHLASTRLALSAANTAEIAGFGRVGTVTDGKAGNRTGLAYRLPVFVPGAPLATVEDRRAAYLGSVGAWIDLAKFFSDGLASGPHEALALRVSMPQPAKPGVATQHSVVFESTPAPSADGPLLRQGRVEFADHGFELAVFALPEQGGRAWGPAAAGISIGALLLALTLWGATTMRVREERRLHEHERQVERFIHRLNMGELTAGLAHELRQPLQGITSVVETLQIESANGKLTPDAMDRRLEEVMSEVRRANGRLEEIHDMSAEEYSVRGDEQVAIDELFAELKAFFTREARKFPYEFVVCQPERAWRVHGSRFALEGVLSNLARNAFQAMREAGMPRGGVTVRAVWDEGDDTLRIVVTDTGPGIPAARIERLFESFNTTKAEGRGIGLSLSRKMLKRYKGAIEARNRPEGGAEFTIHLQLLGAPAAAPIHVAD